MPCHCWRSDWAWCRSPWSCTRTRDVKMSSWQWGIWSTSKWDLIGWKPYPVHACIGEVAYRMDLPTGCHIHPIFHISKLQKALGATHRAQKILALLTQDLVWMIEPLDVLALLWGAHCLEVLIRWRDLPAFGSTWVIRIGAQTLPKLQLEDKLRNKERQENPQLTYWRSRGNWWELGVSRKLSSSEISHSDWFLPLLFFFLFFWFSTINRFFFFKKSIHFQELIGILPDSLGSIPRESFSSSLPFYSANWAYGKNAHCQV